MVVRFSKGKRLESIINKTNEYYLSVGLGTVKKVPDSMKVLRHYEKNKSYRICIPVDEGLVDYVGCIQGKMMAFDAKETKGKSFPIENLSDRQIKVFKEFQASGCECFLIINFTESDNFYKVPFLELNEYIEKTGKKSIPEKQLLLNSYEIKIVKINEYLHILDYFC
jgi:recombination protein U